MLQNNTHESLKKWHRFAMLEGIMNDKELFYHKSPTATKIRQEMQELSNELMLYKHPNEEYGVEMIAA